MVPVWRLADCRNLQCHPHLVGCLDCHFVTHYRERSPGEHPITNNDRPCDGRRHGVDHPHSHHRITFKCARKNTEHQPPLSACCQNCQHQHPAALQSQPGTPGCQSSPHRPIAAATDRLHCCQCPPLGTYLSQVRFQRPFIQKSIIVSKPEIFKNPRFLGLNTDFRRYKIRGSLH